MNQPTFAPGTVITNRNRLWRVDAQAGDVLIATPIDGGAPEPQQFYLPLEYIRPGRLEPPSPEIVGQPSSQDLLLRAYRLSLLHGTAPMLSLQRSRVIPKDYQLVPVVMALEMPRVRLLIADDVGLGKTIEAGLIITELLARQMASRVLVIVPANLREQWHEALDYFFHIPARHRREMERELPAGVETVPNGFPHPPFKWDDERRAHLRADLDTLYGHLYGLTREELDYILDTFPIVRRKDEARYGEYRTKRLALEYYEKLGSHGF